MAMTYTVQHGDTMASIARKFGVTLAALEAANPQIPNFNLIFPGQLINIPENVGGVPLITYQVLDAVGGWGSIVPDNEFAFAPNGVVGLRIVMTTGQALYDAFFNGAFQPGVNSPNELGDGASIFKAVKLLVANPPGVTVTYTVLDANFQSFSGTNFTSVPPNPTAGSPDLRGIKVHLTTT